MKIIHTADIHLESKMNKLGTVKSKIRQSEVRDSFFNLIDYANENDVKIILISGDLFDSKSVRLNTLRELLSKINSVPEIDFIYLNGNHDDVNVFNQEKLGELPVNLKLIFKEASFKYGDINITAIDLSKYPKNEYINKLSLNPNDYNIVMLHGSLNEIPLTKLAGKHIDYLALGDIHIPDIKEIKLDTRGIYGYSGILEPRGFDELGERGFFLLEIKNKNLKRTFIKNNQRTYHIIPVDITGLNNYTLINEEINKKIKEIPKDDIVRVLLKGKYDYETIKDINTLLINLENKFFYAELNDESELDYTKINFEKEVSLRGEFYRLVKSSDLSIKEMDKVLEYGLKALKGEDLEL